MKYDTHILEIRLIQNVWRKTLDLKMNINNEFQKLKNILYTIIQNIGINRDIYSEKNYNKTLNLIEYVQKIFEHYPNEFKVKELMKISKFVLYRDMAKIKLNIIEITRLVGCLDVYQSIFLYMDLNDINPEYTDYLNYFNRFLKITHVDSYLSTNKNNISFVLNTYGKKIPKTTVTLTSYQIDKPTINKYTTILSDIRIQAHGVKLFIPCHNKLLILFGYFENDHFNSYRYNNIFDNKYTDILKKFKNLDVNEAYKKNYLRCLSVKNFNIFTATQICNECVSQYNKLCKRKNLNISKIVKDFVLSNDLKRRECIINLVLDSEDSNSGYIASLLIDLVNSDRNFEGFDKIYKTFHWNIRCLIKFNKTNIKTSIINTEIEIPYEKKIHLLKASESIKNKARDKLKEINSGKPGESNNKATQYLEGLLKIPFGIHKKSVIRYKLDETLDIIKKTKMLLLEQLSNLEEDCVLCDYELNISNNLIEFLKTSKNRKPLDMVHLANNLKLCLKCINENFYLKNFYKKESLITYFKKHKVSELIQLLEHENIYTIKKRKNPLIELLINTPLSQEKFQKYKKEITSKSKFNIISNSPEGGNIINNIKELISVIDKYTLSQKKYFKNIDTILNNAIYGLDSSKLQIKRMLAQWINGKNEGYIFGFEGPPGTGKTTLAKKGIAQCMKDENGNDRPFIFIALGWSSNVSTLEGHNYTYVGSTWGRIVDGLMESKCMNPIIYIDELDKISKTEHGKELVGILTHLTDKSQNMGFMDKYFSGIKLNLSKCMIIFSYNDASLIDPILLDRIHRIQIKPLDKPTKIKVSHNHLLPEILDNVGYLPKDIIISDDELAHIIDTYTYEAGARKKKKKLYEIYRDVNLKSLEDPTIIPFTITNKFIDSLFEDYPKHENVKIYDEALIGTINGLFATATGIGGITMIESKKYLCSTRFTLKLTGMQGDVMKESMEVARTLSEEIVPKSYYSGEDSFGVHIHCPAGATKKDGPSAGTAITLAIISLLSGIPIRNNVGITGEINLNGRVLPIGGLYSKAQGGKLAGLNKILCPEKNRKDLEKIRRDHPGLEDDTFEIKCVATIYEAMKELFIFPDKKTETLLLK